MKIITIGRSSSNNVNINDPLASRAHCQIIQDDNGNFRLIDTNSLNGTYVNGEKRHGEVPLNKTDIVRIGNTTLPWLTYFNNPGSTNGGDDGRTAVRESIDIGPNIPSPPPSKPNNFMVWAILSTLCCCLPLGIVSIVYASKVDGLWAAGDYFGAENAAQSARTWFWWAFGLGIVSNLFLIIYEVCVGLILS